MPEGKFDEFAVKMGKRYDELWLANKGYPHQIDETESFFENIDVRGKVVLDLGAGTLRFSLDSVDRGSKEVVGLDLYDGMLKWGMVKARNLGVEDKISVIVADGRHLPFRQNVFDIVVSIELFEHIDKGQVLLLNEIHRILKSPGVAAINTWNAIPWAISGMLGFSKGVLESWDGRFYYRFYYPWEFKYLLLSSRFKKLRLIGVHNTYFLLLVKKLMRFTELPKAQSLFRLIIPLEIAINKAIRKISPVNRTTGMFLLAILKKN